MLADTANLKSLDIEPRALGIKCNGQEITNVTTGSQAEQKGIKVGWKVISIAGTKVNTTQEVTKALAAGKKGGTKYKAEFLLPGAVSTKERTETGHKVTTIVKSTAATAAAPIEPGTDETDKAVADAADKKQKEEAEAAKKKAEEMAAAIKAEEERKANGNGLVKLVYETYDNQFKITDGCLGPDDEGRMGAEYLDEEYCLNFVMPNCKIHLCTVDKKSISKMDEGDEKWALFVKEEPAGTFHELQKDNTYFVIIVEDTEEARKDAERMASVWASMDQGHEISGGTSKQSTDVCSCKSGLPCVDKPVCENWDHRFVVAEANGWNPDPATRAAFMDPQYSKGHY
jgi:hypothetical protein